jgi:hypothetical protein
MSGIAIAVRESIVRCRDGMFLEDWMTVASDIMLATANAGKSFFFASRPGVMSINSNVAYEFSGSSLNTSLLTSTVHLAGLTGVTLTSGFLILPVFSQLGV